jgi:putative ATPase
LSHVESGDVVLIGATTENPSFEVNAALLSRCRVVVLKPLDEQQLVQVMGRALADAERGLASLNPRPPTTRSASWPAPRTATRAPP